MKSAALLRDTDAEDANRMAYKTMNMCLYLITTLIYYVIIVIGAIFIPGIDIVFDFVGAIAITSVAFYFPAYLYPRAVKKFNVKVEGDVATNLKLACLYMFIGVICMSLGIFSTVYAILNP